MRQVRPFPFQVSGTCRLWPQCRQILSLIGCMALVGCGLLREDPGFDNLKVSAAGCASIGESPLVFWASVTHGRLSATSDRRDFETSTPINLIFPVAVAAYANELFIADSGHRAVLRFDQALDTLTVFTKLDVDLSAMDLYLDDDLSLYVVDARNAQVLRFDENGRILQRFQNSANLAHPVAVVTDRARAQVLVADRLYAQVLKFNQLGTLTGAISVAPGGAQFDTTVAMARRGDELYVVDQQAHRVHVIGLDRAFQSYFGTADLKRPVAVAADRYGRILVADDADNAIKVFSEDELEVTVGPRAPAGRFAFAQVSDLWVDEDFLYVADAVNSTVQVFQILSPCR